MVTRNDIHEHLMAQYKKDSTHSTHNPTDTQCYRVTMVVLKLLATAAVLLALTPHWVDSTIISIPHGKGHALVKRGVLSNRPSVPCNSAHAGKRVPVDSETLWLCQMGRWQAYRLAYGNFEDYPANSCLDIRDHRLSTPPSKAYYINTTDSCTEESNITKVYCNMDDDGGGWTLVWKHSAMEVLPLTESMRYFSDYYKACTDLEVGWCNIPIKTRLNPTEMMIAAYHKKTLVYAYKGIFNKNLDWHWSGGILLDPKKVVDQCNRKSAVQPAPDNQNNRGGLSFDKWTPYDYTVNCDVYHGSLSSPRDCRWENCHLPTSISPSVQHTQMTVAIYVR